jgi:hypothetical protein
MNEQAPPLLPESIEELIIFMYNRSGSQITDVGRREAAMAKISSLLVKDSFVPTMKNLSQELTQTRMEMRQASDAAARHTQALVRATWVLALLTGFLFIATVISLFK